MVESRGKVGLDHNDFNKVCRNSCDVKLRIVAAGGVELVLSIVLYVLRGYHPVYLGLLGLGIIFIFLGLFWR